MEVEGVELAHRRLVLAAIPPGEEELFWLAVDIASSSLETAPGDAEELETLARSLNVIFRAQETV